MRRGLAYAALGVVLLLAPACQGDPEPQFAPLESPGPSSTPPEPTPSDEPEALSPEETAEEWVDAYNAALNDGDLASLRQLQSRACDTCERFIEDLDDIIRNGGEIRTRGWSLEGARLAERSTQPRPVVTGQLVMHGGSTTPSEGAKPFTYERSSDQVFFEFSGEAGSWGIDFIYFKG